MSKKEEKHIKNILNTIEANKAPVDFTNKVMKDVVMLSSNEDALKSASLSSLLNNSVKEEVSNDFTSAVMSQIEAQRAIEYKPLISKKAWLIIATAVMALIVFAFIGESPNQSTSIFDTILPYLEQSEIAFTNPFKNVSFSPLLTISLVCLSSMLLFDTLFKRKLSVQN